MKDKAASISDDLPAADELWMTTAKGCSSFRDMAPR
jgi:hypothetical protein